MKIADITHIFLNLSIVGSNLPGIRAIKHQTYKLGSGLSLSITMKLKPMHRKLNYDILLKKMSSFKKLE